MRLLHRGDARLRICGRRRREHQVGVRRRNGKRARRIGERGRQTARLVGGFARRENAALHVAVGEDPQRASRREAFFQGKRRGCGAVQVGRTPIGCRRGSKRARKSDPLHAGEDSRSDPGMGRIDMRAGGGYPRRRLSLRNGFVGDDRFDRAAIEGNAERVFVGFIGKARIHAVRIELGLLADAVGYARKRRLHEEMGQGQRTHCALAVFRRIEAHRGNGSGAVGGNQADAGQRLAVGFALAKGHLIVEGRIAQDDRTLRVVNDHGRLDGAANLGHVPAEVQRHRLPLGRGDDQASRRMHIGGKHVAAALRDGHAPRIPLRGDVDGFHLLGCNEHIRSGRPAHRLGKRRGWGERRGKRAGQRNVRGPADKALRFGYTVVRHAESFATASGGSCSRITQFGGPRQNGPPLDAAVSGVSPYGKAISLKGD